LKRPIVSLEDWYDLYHAAERDHHRLSLVTVLVLVSVAVAGAWHLQGRRRGQHSHSLAQPRRSAKKAWSPWQQQRRPTTFIDVKRKQN
jgi:hypothetical protein